MANLAEFRRDLKGKSFREMEDLFWFQSKADFDAIVGRLEIMCFEIPERYPRIFRKEEIDILRSLIDDAHRGTLKMAELRKILESMDMKAERYMKEKKK